MSERFIKNNGRLGRSYGCPALPQELNAEIIKNIKGGSLLFAYYNDGTYLRSSKFLQKVEPKLLAALCEKPYSINVSNS